MSGWPDKDKPGVPLHPERDGWHWLFDPENNKSYPEVWVAEIGAWAVGDAWTPRIVAETGLYYLGPVLTPDEADALRAENARLREALSWYVKHGAWPVELVRDAGDTARAALAWEVKP